MFMEFYLGSLEIGRFNYDRVALIPKKEGANTVTQFGPISLLSLW